MTYGRCPTTSFRQPTPRSQRASRTKTLHGEPRTLTVRCAECAATGSRSLSSDSAHATFAWDQRMGRLSVR
jgi:hypothetical protein